MLCAANTALSAHNHMLDDTPIWAAWLSQHQLPPLTVAIDLKLPEQLPATISELCATLGCQSRVLRAVLAVLAAKRLVSLDEESERCSLTPTGEAFLLRRSAVFAGPYLMSSAACAPLHERCKAALLAPEDGTNPTDTSAAWASGSLGGDAHRAQATLIFMHALHAPTAMRSAHKLAQLAQSWGGAARPEAGRPLIRMLDAGGGSGVYAVCLAKACAALQVDVGELPEVAACAPICGSSPGPAGAARHLPRTRLRAGSCRDSRRRHGLRAA